MTTKIEDFDEQSRKIIQQWFVIRSIAKSTREVYCAYVTQFIEYNGKTLYNIYTTAKEEQRQQIPLEERQLTQQILNYKYYIDEECKYAATTRKLKLNVIFSFCKAFKLETPDIRQKTAICDPKNYERPITKQEIQLMMNASPLRERAFISLQATTGMASKEARTLTISNLITMINNELGTKYKTITELLENRKTIQNHKVYKIQLTRSKVSYRYITFIPSETLTKVFDYLNLRTKYKDNRKIKDNGLIFVTNTGKPMNGKAVTGMYREMGKRVGFESEENTYRFWRSHNIRKYFYNIAEEYAGQIYADEWLGHTPTKVTQAYARRENRMREAYLQCLPHLSLENDTGATSINEQLLILEKEISRLKENMQ